MIDADKLDALAKGLTKAQRVVIEDFPKDGLHQNVRYPVGGLVSALWRSGLVELAPRQAGTQRLFILTPLGLALRNHLRAQEGSAGGGV